VAAGRAAGAAAQSAPLVCCSKHIH